MFSADRRHAPRYRQHLDVELLSAPEPRRTTAADVSRRGLFLVCDSPPPVGERVTLRIHAATGSFDTAGTVVRHGTTAHSQAAGAGVVVVPLDDDSRQHWDTLLSDVEGVSGLALPTRTSDAGVCFVVQLPTVAALEQFFRTSVQSPKTFHVASPETPVGTEVLFALVHPTSRAEFNVRARVVEFDAARPGRIGIAFLPVEPSQQEAFKRFAGIVEDDSLLSFMGASRSSTVPRPALAAQPQPKPPPMHVAPPPEMPTEPPPVSLVLQGTLIEDVEAMTAQAGVEAGATATAAGDSTAGGDSTADGDSTAPAEATPASEPTTANAAAEEEDEDDDAVLLLEEELAPPPPAATHAPAAASPPAAEAQPVVLPNPFGWPPSGSPGPSWSVQPDIAPDHAAMPEPVEVSAVVVTGVLEAPPPPPSPTPAPEAVRPAPTLPPTIAAARPTAPPPPMLGEPEEEVAARPVDRRALFDFNWNNGSLSGDEE